MARAIKMELQVMLLNLVNICSKYKMIISYSGNIL